MIKTDKFIYIWDTDSLWEVRSRPDFIMSEMLASDGSMPSDAVGAVGFRWVMFIPAMANMTSAERLFISRG
jgi:hypothetical protein